MEILSNGIHIKELSPNTFDIGADGKGIQVGKFENFCPWNSNFSYVGGIDIDMDANVDLIALDTNGILYLFNHELILMPSFPLDVKLAPQYYPKTF